jgi:ribosome modulation factor
MAAEHDDAIHAEGYRAGREGRRLAIDCPYLPGTDLPKRQRWLKGFSEGRLASPPAIDDDLPAPVPTPHAG